MNKVLSKIYTRVYAQCVYKMMRIVICLGLCGMVPSKSANVLGYIVGQVNEGMCVIENWLLIGFELGSLVGKPQL